MTDKKENQIVEEAIRRAESEEAREALAAGEHWEEGLEALRRVARLDEAAAAERLAGRLAALSGRRRRLWLRVGSRAAAVAAVAVVVLGSLHWLRREPQPIVPQVYALQIGEITVPTLLHEEDSRIVACEVLEPAGEAVYVAAQPVASGDCSGQAPVSEAVVYRTLVIPAGYIYNVALADGSTVTLNAGSELRFPDRFADTLRRVELKGEAYFRVAKAAVPFVVSGGGTEVKVYGTQFNFLCSERLGMAEAVLVEGSIGMRAGGQELKIVPNQRISFQQGKELAIEPVDPGKYTAWLNGVFKYDAMPLNRIIDDIARWYGIDIDLSPALATQIFTLEFDKSATLEWTLRALEKIIGKSVKKEGGIYTIK